MSQRKTAVVLFNLGGPDSLDAVRPFLFNLFNDRRIVGAPAPIRAALAAFIAGTRTPSAQENYARMGGRSPIEPETRAQADALQAELDRRLGPNRTKCILGMRYWRPFAADAARAATEWGADDAILLPLYPQFSSTTTLSAMDAWSKAWPKPWRTVCCYPANARFARAHADAILEVWRKAGEPPQPRVLFSAHGLPQRTIDAGDSYQWQVERTVEAVRPLLPADWDHVICYQSRVGPLKWIGPATPEEIERAARAGRGIIISPIAFVSEHIETLVELDVEYAELAHELQAPFYLRAPALGVSQSFIASLADLVGAALETPSGARSETGARICPSQFGLCPMKMTPHEHL